MKPDCLIANKTKQQNESSNVPSNLGKHSRLEVLIGSERTLFTIF